MDTPLKERFIFVTMRFKRMDVFPSCAAGLQQSELAVMARASAGCVCGGTGMCVSDIHEKLHISKPAVSQTLNSLERKGYIIRKIDSSDRRKITVTLTPAGEAVLAEAMYDYEQSLDAVLEQFGARNVSQLIELMNQLVDILEKRGPECVRERPRPESGKCKESPRSQSGKCEESS